MTKQQKERMVMVRSHLDFIQESITELTEKLDKMVAPYEGAITLLCTTPGVSRVSASPSSPKLVPTCLSLPILSAYAVGQA